MTTTILIAEDDQDINNLLSRLLTDAGYHVRQTYSGTEAELCLTHYTYDLILLDLMLPGISGETLLSKLRSQGKTLPIIVISAKASVADRIELLNSGADDYIVKPFDTGEVLARVDAQLRRTQKFSKNDDVLDTLSYGSLILSPSAAEATLLGIPLSLTAREFKILLLLMRHPKTVFTREQLFQQVWEYPFCGDDNTVNVHISNIRKKLAAIDPNRPYIKTVWGIGFKMAEEL